MIERRHRMKVVMLTTIDNPFSPYNEFDQWNAFDQAHGYFTCSYLARIVKTSDELSEADEAIEIENAIDEIVSLNLLGIYKKLVIDVEDEEEEEVDEEDS
jgi:hypothetical protein